MRAWNELSMADKAAVMKLAIDGGVYDLNSIKSGYNEYAKGGKKNQDTWTMEDETKYREWRSSLPANLRNTDDNLYDMRGAYKAEMKPTLESDGRYHLQSRDPKTGRILKSPLHPTYLQAIATDASMGYYPVVDNQGNTYTQTWEGNQFKSGGSIHIKPSKRGTFTAAASKHGKSVQAFASQVLAHPENYSPAMRKKANFARNAAKWKHGDGGNLYGNGGLTSLIPLINVPEALKGAYRAAKERAYKTIVPQSYNIPKATKEFVSGKERNLKDIEPVRNEEWARYLGVPYEGESNFEPSPYRPTKGQTYDTVLRFKDESQIVSDEVLNQMLERQKKTGKNSFLVTGNGGGLGSYTLSLGEDEKGKYISYYDDWDINPFKGVNARTNIPVISDIEDIVPGSHPFTVYGRRYYEEKKQNKQKDLGGWRQ